MNRISALLLLIAAYQFLACNPLKGAHETEHPKRLGERHMSAAQPMAFSPEHVALEEDKDMGVEAMMVNSPNATPPSKSESAKLLSPEVSTHSGPGLDSPVWGILSLSTAIFAWVSAYLFIWLLGPIGLLLWPILGGLAIGFGIKGRQKGRRRRELATAGIVIGIFQFLLIIGSILAVRAIFSNLQIQL